VAANRIGSVIRGEGAAAVRITDRDGLDVFSRPSNLVTGTCLLQGAFAQQRTMSKPRCPFSGALLRERSLPWRLFPGCPDFPKHNPSICFATKKRV
jgi:hypothetical protein